VLDRGAFLRLQVYAADEAFTTGTMGALVPVSVVDGRVLTHPVGETMQRLQVCLCSCEVK
jgi:branched-subunit amino acid aminotransferase/4-amino-4-deoxychorismate lyase